MNNPALSSSTIANNLIDMKTAFYDSLFGPCEEGNDDLNGIEAVICDDLRKLFDGVEHISTYIPALPETAMELIAVLQNEHATFEQVSAIARKDPVIAGNIVKVANTPIFRRSATPLESIDQAAKYLGMGGIRTIAWTALVNESLQISNIYFRVFGTAIWEHSQEVALACEYISGSNNPFLAYMLGLIHDTGKIIVFNKICDAFRSSHASGRPGGKMFRTLMTEYSLNLSSLVASEWGLDRAIVEALEQQSLPEKGELAQILYQSNLCSEVYLLSQKGELDSDSAMDILNSINIPPRLIDFVFNKE